MINFICFLNGNVKLNYRPLEARENGSTLAVTLEQCCTSSYLQPGLSYAAEWEDKRGIQGVIQAIENGKKKLKLSCSILGNNGGKS